MAGAVLTDRGLKLRLVASLDRRLFLRLFRSDQPVNPTSVLGEFTPAAFPAYADQELTGLFSAPAIDAVGRAWSAVYNVTWTRGAGGIAETEYGWLLYESPDPDSVLVAGKRLTVPHLMAVAGDLMMVSVIVYLLRG